MIKSVKGRCWYATQSCVVVLIILAWSCGKKERVPEGILSQDKMVAVMSELYILEQKVGSLGVKRDSLAQISEVMKVKVLANAGITDSVFKKSMDYYMEHPKILELIYTSIVDSLNLREQRVPAVQPR